MPDKRLQVRRPVTHQGEGLHELVDLELVCPRTRFVRTLDDVLHVVVPQHRKVLTLGQSEARLPMSREELRETFLRRAGHEQQHATVGLVLVGNGPDGFHGLFAVPRPCEFLNFIQKQHDSIDLRLS